MERQHARGSRMWLAKKATEPLRQQYCYSYQLRKFMPPIGLLKNFYMSVCPVVGDTGHDRSLSFES
jgi:hypothetical protein